MGGINHLLSSKASVTHRHFPTLMSKYLSEARAAFELANVHLGEILLAEMEGNRGSVDDTLAALQRCGESVGELRKTAAMLSQDMRRLGYSDPPTLKTLDLSAIGGLLCREDLVEINQWRAAVLVMRDHGFEGILEQIEHETFELIRDSSDLYRAVTLLASVAEQGLLKRLIDRNEKGNIKVQFARISTKLNSFQGFFLASCLLSNELWYAHNNGTSVLSCGTSQANVA